MVVTTDDSSFRSSRYCKEGVAAMAFSNETSKSAAMGGGSQAILSPFESHKRAVLATSACVSCGPPASEPGHVFVDFLAQVFSENDDLKVR
jgi:hypothetical protein